MDTTKKNIFRPENFQNNTCHSDSTYGQYCKWGIASDPGSYDLIYMSQDLRIATSNIFKFRAV